MILEEYNLLVDAIEEQDVKLCLSFIEEEEDLFFHPSDDFDVRVYKIINNLNSKSFAILMYGLIEKNHLIPFIEKRELHHRLFYYCEDDSTFIESYNFILNKNMTFPSGLITSVIKNSDLTNISLQFLIDIKANFKDELLFRFVDEKIIDKLDFLNSKNIKIENCLKNLNIDGNTDFVTLFHFIQIGGRSNCFLYSLLKSKNKKVKPFIYYFSKKYLLNNLDTVNDFCNDFTPLHLAIIFNESKIIALLLNNNADIKLSSTNKKTKKLNSVTIKPNTNCQDLAESLNIDLNKIRLIDEVDKDHNIPKLSESFNNELILGYNAISDYFQNLDSQSKSIGLSKLKSLSTPEIPELLFILAQEKWGELKEHHLKLIHLVLFFENIEFSYHLGPYDVYGGCMFFNWRSFIKDNILYSSSTGPVFARPNNKNIKFQLSSTYKKGLVFLVQLDIDTLLKKLFLCRGLETWEYFFISPKYNLIDCADFDFEKEFKRVNSEIIFNDFKENC